MNNRILSCKIEDLLIIKPNHKNWYDMLDIVQELRKSKVNVILLDRYTRNDVFIITEKQMNDLGWYKK